MTSNNAFLMFLLPVELLLQIPYTVAMSFGGSLGPVFESLDFFSTFNEFGFKSLGLVPGESVGEIAEGILTVGVTLGIRFGRFLQGGLFFFFRRLRFLGIGGAFLYLLVELD